MIMLWFYLFLLNEPGFYLNEVDVSSVPSQVVFMIPSKLDHICFPFCLPRLRLTSLLQITRHRGSTQRRMLQTRKPASVTSWPRPRYFLLPKKLISMIKWPRPHMWWVRVGSVCVCVCAKCDGSQFEGGSQCCA